MTLKLASYSAAGAWSLNELSGVFQDTTPNNRDLTEFGTVTRIAGKYGNAVEFGTSPVGRLQTTGSPFGSGVFTGKLMFRIWARPKATTPEFGSPMNHGGVFTQGWNIRWRLDHYSFNIRDSTGFVTATSPTIILPDDEWHLIHGWYDASVFPKRLGIAVNAETAVEVNPTGTIFITGPLVFAGNFDGFGALYDGAIDDPVALVGYIFDGTERLEDFNNGPFTDWNPPILYGRKIIKGNQPRLVTDIKPRHVVELEP